MKPALAFGFLWPLATLLAADSIPSSQAKDHIGESATVCGNVASARYLQEGRRITFLNFDKPGPDHPFIAVIYEENRSKFGSPENDYRGKDVCVTGKIEEYNQKPEIVLTDPKQIKVQGK
jgi:hypothetical protein